MVESRPGKVFVLGHSFGGVAALVAFFGEIVMISPGEIALMKTRPSWPGLLASVESSIRQDRALSAYRFDAARMRTLQTPVLLLMGGNTASPQLKLAVVAYAVI